MDFWQSAEHNRILTLEVLDLIITEKKRELSSVGSKAVTSVMRREVLSAQPRSPCSGRLMILAERSKAAAEETLCTINLFTPDISGPGKMLIKVFGVEEGLQMHQLILS